VAVTQLESFGFRSAAPAGVATLEPVTMSLVIEEEIHERHIEILYRPDRRLITTLEMLSPANKEEPGRTLYLAKRKRFDSSAGAYGGVGSAHQGTKVAARTDVAGRRLLRHGGAVESAAQVRCLRLEHATSFAAIYPYRSYRRTPTCGLILRPCLPRPINALATAVPSITGPPRRWLWMPIVWLGLLNVPGRSAVLMNDGQVAEPGGGGNDGASD